MVTNTKLMQAQQYWKLSIKTKIAHPQICYVPEVDPIQTCDTCIVEVNGKLVRSCSTKAENGMNIDLHQQRKSGPNRSNGPYIRKPFAILYRM